MSGLIFSGLDGNDKKPNQETAKKEDETNHVGSYASSIDSLNRYQKNQPIWIEFSEIVITETSKYFSDPQSALSFRGAFELLAKKRSEIAKSLEHGKSEGRMGSYGVFRTETTFTYEIFYSEKPEQIWKEMAPQIFKEVGALVSSIEENGTELDDYESDDDDDEDKKSSGSNDRLIRYDHPSYQGVLDKKNHSAEIVVKSPPFDNLPHYSEGLSRIQLDGNKITIGYADVNKHNQKGDFEIANLYLKEMLACDSNDMNNFLVNTGKLCHLIAHILPLKLGTAGVTEWLIRSVAHAKGINLGPFNLKEVLSWDFRALVTPDREEYATWFSKSAFLNPTLYENVPESFRFNQNQGHATSKKI